MDIWAELRDPIGQAFAQVLDAAVFAGTYNPASCPEAIIPAAVAAGNVQPQAATVAQGGIIAYLEGSAKSRHTGSLRCARCFV